MRNFKVLLINPPYFFNTSAAKVTHLAMEKKPPLGVLYIASYLKKHSDFAIKILDAELLKMNEAEIKKVIADFQPHIVGISTVSFKIYPVRQIIKAVKQISSDIHICLGGPHLKIYPRETLAYPEVDSIVIGDGEIPFLKICQALASDFSPLAGGGDVRRTEWVEAEGEYIPGCYTKNNIPADGNFKKFEVMALSQLPRPDITLLDYEKYRSFLTNDIIATAVTSRGCPHQCIFCQLDRQVRLTPVGRVVDEIETYLKLGIKEIEFYDETFNITTQRVIDFADEILKRGLKFKWSFRGRVNAVNEEMLAKIKKAGCQRIQYGVEAGSNKTLSTMKKGTTVEIIKRCFELTKSAGIETVAYFMIGNPGETKNDIMDTINFAKEIKADYVNFAVFLLVPGVEAYQMALEQKVIDRDIWRQYVINPQEKLPMLYWDRELPEKELMKLQSLANKKFYLRPLYLLNRLRKISPKNIFSYARAFYYMVIDMVKS